jgi:hypothetical protein
LSCREHSLRAKPEAGRAWAGINMNIAVWRRVDGI